MRQEMKRFVLLLLAMMPIASVAFAAKSSLRVAHIAKGNAPDRLLAGCTAESH